MSLRPCKIINPLGGESAQYTTMPTASASNVGDIVQYVGATGSGYTKGYFYQCSAQGTTPETYFWSRINVQPAGAGAAEWGDIAGTLSNQTDLQTALNGKQATLTAGPNITISNNTISATDTTYSAGTNITITNGVISAAGAANTDLGNLTATGEAHFSKPTATGTITSGGSQTLADNTVYTASTITSITLAYPASPATTFISEVQMTTGTGTITFAIDSGTTMKGADCSDGTFTPLASKTYSILFGISGTSKYGIVISL